MTREIAIGILEMSKHMATSGRLYNQAIDMAIEALSERTGEWVEYGMNTDGTHNIKCNQCGAGFRTRGHANSHNTKERFKWCPTCGADMRGGGADGKAKTSV